MNDDIALLRLIRGLSADPLSLVHLGQPDFWNPDSLMRWNAERRFHYAFCERIWWNLTLAERDAVRWSVIAEHPEYRRSMHGPTFDRDCMVEIARLLEQSRDH